MNNMYDYTRGSFSKRLILFLGFFTAIYALLMLKACDNDEPAPGNIDNELTGNSVNYTLEPESGSGVTGTVDFEETVANTTIITFAIAGGVAGQEHPVHIRNNSKAEGGGIAISLGAIGGSSGDLSLEVTEMDDGTVVTYNDLLDFDGHINIHASPSDLATIKARVDIGVDVE